MATATYAPAALNTLRDSFALHLAASHAVGRPLTAAEYAAVARVVRIMKKTQRDWHPIFQNCNDFGIAVAEALGMRRPHSLMAPNVWVSTLRTLNQR